MNVEAKLAKENMHTQIETYIKRLLKKININFLLSLKCREI